MRRWLPTFARIHHLVPEYFDECPPSEVRPFVADLASDHSPLAPSERSALVAAYLNCVRGNR